MIGHPLAGDLTVPWLKDLLWLLIHVVLAWSDQQFVVLASVGDQDQAPLVQGEGTLLAFVGCIMHVPVSVTELGSAYL